MATVNVVTEDKMISVDGEGREGDYVFPANLWAVQWSGSVGHAEWTNGPNTVISASDVDVYIAAWTANAPEAQTPPTAQENTNHTSLGYLKETDWYAIRYAETGVAVPADISSARAAARTAIVV